MEENKRDFDVMRAMLKEMKEQTRLLRKIEKRLENVTEMNDYTGEALEYLCSGINDVSSGITYIAERGILRDAYDEYVDNQSYIGGVVVPFSQFCDSIAAAGQNDEEDDEDDENNSAMENTTDDGMRKYKINEDIFSSLN